MRMRIVATSNLFCCIGYDGSHYYVIGILQNDKFRLGDVLNFATAPHLCSRVSVLNITQATEHVIVAYPKWPCDDLEDAVNSICQMYQPDIVFAGNATVKVGSHEYENQVIAAVKAFAAQCGGTKL